MDPRTSLAIWLRTGRAERNMSLDDVARVTKIQTRILERLEAGKHEGLPAEVFVRGFVRSVARCLGLDEDEALERWGACAQLAPPPVATPIGPAARGVVEAMSDLAPNAARSPRILRTGEMPVYVPPDEPETMLLPMTGTLVIEKLEVAPAGSLGFACAPLAVEAAVEAPIEAAPAVEVPIAEAPIAEVPGAEAPGAEAPVVEAPVVETAEATPTTKKKRGKGTGKGRGKRKSLATGTPSEPAPVITVPPADIALEAPVAVVAAPPAEAVVGAASTEPANTEPASEVETRVEAVAPVEGIEGIEGIEAAPVGVVDATAPAELPADAPVVAAVEASEAVEDPFIAAAIEAAEARSVAVEVVVGSDAGWTPKMPPLATVSQPWRISRPQHSALPLTPSLVIDDSDPESAARAVEEREAEKDPAPRRSFLPPILLDREDRSARQGGLTLAVIILLIAATLTLSYLMRRPSSSGDGVTQADVPTSVLG